MPLVSSTNTTITLPDSFFGILELGDLLNRQPVHYIFRATAFVDPDGSGTITPGDIVDSTPANFKFVVVDNVAQFIENRRATDEQPIKELDRP